jgi:hypothetical protein
MNTLYDLYNSPETFLNLPNLYQDKKQSNLRGNIFEKYAKIILMYGYYKNYQLLDENYKPISIEKTEDAENERINYLKTHKIIDSCAEGIFDIKLIDNLTKRFLFLSSKYYAKEKTIDHYDILEMAENVKGRDIQIGLCIKNKDEFKERVKFSRNNTIKKYINFDNIIDYNDLREMFIELIKNKGIKKDSLNIFNVSNKHQELIKLLQKNNIILDCILNNQIEFIQSIILNNHYSNILIISTDKNMQINWTKEYFNKFYDFDIFNIQINNLDVKLNSKNITIIDYELFKNNYKLIKNYQLISLDNYEFYDKLFNKIKYECLLLFSISNNKIKNDKEFNIIRYNSIDNSKLII